MTAPRFLLRTLFGLMLCLPGLSQAQGLAAGRWRYHAYFGRDSLLALSPAMAYASAGNSVLTYDRATGYLGTLTKIDGLSEVNVTALAHAYDREILVIGYRSGGIDIVQGGRVTTINGLKQADLSASKAILGLDIIGNYAFASGAFGFLVIDLEKREVRYSNTSLDISTNNQPVTVTSVCLNSGLYYFSTSIGILTIPATANLQDSRLFTRTLYGPASGLPIGASIRNLASAGDYVYAVFREQGVFYRDASDGFWHIIPGIGSSPFRSLRGVAGRLILSAGSELYRLEGVNLTAVTPQDSLLGAPFISLQDKDGEVFSASMSGALVHIQDSAVASLQTASPGFPSTFSLYGYDDKMVSLSGGYDRSYYPQLGRSDGLGIFHNNNWTHVSSKIPGKRDLVLDMTVAAYRKKTKELYVGCYGNGLFVLPDDTARIPYIVSDTTSANHGHNGVIPGDGNTLGNFYPDTFPGLFTRVDGVAFDKNGNLWVSQFYPVPLHLRDLSDQWYAYAPPLVSPYENRSAVGELYVDDEQNKFMRTLPSRGSGNSIMVLANDNKTWASINTNTGQGSLPSSDVYDCALDKDGTGTLWICTGVGMAVLYSAATNVFSGNPYDANLPIFDGRYLLENDICTAIILDGGNRKWIGTRASGIWLFDKDVTKVLAHYTAENSPLPSNDIQDLSIVPATGELFVVTADGLVSLSTVATDATLAEAENSCVRIFPNPVRPGYTGQIAIDCLPENAVVKITDAGGHLVYEAKAAGGGLIWNGYDYQGRRPKPGVYLVYAYSDAQTAKVVGRFAMVE